MSEPIKRTVVRYACPYCGRQRARKMTTVEHIEHCWSNPDNKTCRTCAFFSPAVSEPCGIGACNCGNSPAFCDLGIDLPENQPVIGCAEWGDAERARWEGVALGGTNHVSELA